MKIYMHVNYLENVFDLEQICASCVASGYDGIELRGRDASGVQTIDQYLKCVAELIATHNLELVLGCPNDAFTDDAAVRRQSIENLKLTVGHAAAMRLKLLNVFAGPLIDPKSPYSDFEKHGSAIVTGEQWSRTVSYFHEAAEFAAECGITLAFETHPHYVHDLGSSTAKLVEEIGHQNVRVNLDWGNLFLHRGNEGLDHELSSLMPYLAYVHVKNVILLGSKSPRAYRGSALRDGDINTFVVIRELIRRGYSGPIALENTLSGDKRRLVVHDLEYLRSILRDLHV